MFANGAVKKSAITETRKIVNRVELKPEVCWEELSTKAVQSIEAHSAHSPKHTGKDQEELPSKFIHAKYSPQVGWQRSNGCDEDADEGTGVNRVSIIFFTGVLLSGVSMSIINTVLTAYQHPNKHPCFPPMTVAMNHNLFFNTTASFSLAL
ncbi:hypothetical protein E2C01_028260 [Portunus trituberculatus]|uniref:Uncharacterized protein n=1 Tax=Portunus trituberculatus TaxID=210409 RepID=A0A5B7ENK3_PORTR|nr:hypothetical protein [Portunus trituberculatus]